MPQHIDDFEVWEYPEFTSNIINEFTVVDAPIEEPLEPEHININDDNHIPEVIEEDVNDAEFIVSPPECIDEKINYLEAIGVQMAAVLSEIDTTLLQAITEIIKQSVKKIILKELSLDDDLIKNMIHQSLEKINKNKASCIIQVSEKDYPVFENKLDMDHVQISIDPSLSTGSFTIKTKFSELQAILEDRLTLLFGL